MCHYSFSKDPSQTHTKYARHVNKMRGCAFMAFMCNLMASSIYLKFKKNLGPVKNNGRTFDLQVANLVSISRLCG